MPMRLTVSLIVGSVVLITILSTLMNPCLLPQKMIVGVSPAMVHVFGSEPMNVSFLISVSTNQGHPISGASIIIKGLGGAGGNISDSNGHAIINMTVQLHEGVYEGYLDVLAKAVCHEAFMHDDMIKIVKST